MFVLHVYSTHGLDIMGGPACPIPVANNSKKDSVKLNYLNHS